MEENVTKNEKKRSSFDPKWVILFLLLTIPFFQVDFLVANVSFAGKAYTACQIIAGGVIGLLILKDRLIKRMSPVILLLAGLLAVMCAASVINGGNLKTAVGYSFATIVICLVIDYAILKDERWPETVSTGKTIRVCVSDNLLGPYSNPMPTILQNWREAPTLTMSLDGKLWYLYVEDYR